MRKTATLLFSILLIAMPACKKESVTLTQGQLTAQRLLSDLSINSDTVYNGYSVFVFDLTTGNSISSGYVSLKITTDGFITLYSQSNAATQFNLALLKTYRFVSQQTYGSPVLNLSLFY